MWSACSHYVKPPPPPHTHYGLAHGCYISCLPSPPPSFHHNSTNDGTMGLCSFAPLHSNLCWAGEVLYAFSAISPPPPHTHGISVTSLQCTSLMHFTKAAQRGLCGSGPLNSNFAMQGRCCMHSLVFNWHLLIIQGSASTISPPPPPSWLGETIGMAEVVR